MRAIQVVLPHAILPPLDYAVPDDRPISVGMWVMVPLRKAQLLGIVYRCDVNSTAPLREVIEWPNLPPLSASFMAFLEQMSRYTMHSLGLIMKMVIPSDHKLLHLLPLPEPPLLESYRALSFSSDQHAAIATIDHLLATHSAPICLLDGVTGSGKTEVYFHFIYQSIRHDPTAQILILLPEIGLSPQWLDRFEAQFGWRPYHWHSGMRPKERRSTWQAIISGKARVIVGARSAIMLPYLHLRLIIVDEEHDTSYKQEEGVIYHARDMAVLRAHHEHIPIFLVSATPSLESVWNMQRGHYHPVTLPSRFHGVSLPPAEIADMKTLPNKKEWITPRLRQALRATLDAGKQSLLFLNRRGFSPLLLCRHCGYRFTCRHCSTWMVWHHTTHHLECHHCGEHRALPSTCPDCAQEDQFAPCGPGVERIAAEVRLLFPTARITEMTRDTMTSEETMGAMITSIIAHEVDIVIGTQMVAKGHHFPALHLVGIIDADMGMHGGDLRASERSYQLLQQVSGRAGREQLGQVVIQTHYPQSPLIHALLRQDRDGFIAQELQGRKLGKMPPFTRLAALVFSASNEPALQRSLADFTQHLPRSDAITVLGPAPAPLHKLRGQFRYRYLLIAPRSFPVQAFIEQWLASMPLPRTIRCKIDIDPYSFM